MSERDLIGRLQAAVVAAGGQRAFARVHDFDPAYINDVLHGKRAFADRILAAIGVERRVTFVVIGAPTRAELWKAAAKRQRAGWRDAYTVLLRSQARWRAVLVAKGR